MPRFGVITFLLVGAISYAAYVMVFYCLRPMGNATAVTLAYAASLALHFTLNKTLTFADTCPVSGSQICVYLGVAAVNYCVSTAVILMLLSASVWPPLAIAVATGTTTLTGYALLSNFVFNPQRRST